jgi:phage baseplate assembly protein W
MSTFIGFNTQNQYKKFTLVDKALIRQDLLNAFNIRQGQLPGRPGYGTRLWDFLFENIGNELTDLINQEVQRTAGSDPRLQINNVNYYARDNGILLQSDLQYVTSLDSERLAIFFNQESRSATYL